MPGQCEGQVILVLQYFGVLGELWETGPQCPNFSKIVKFCYIDIWSFNFFYLEWAPLTFGQVVQEILLNNY